MKDSRIPVIEELHNFDGKYHRTASSLSEILFSGRRGAFPRVTNAWDHLCITSQALSPTLKQLMHVKVAAQDDRRPEKVKLDSFQCKKNEVAV